jgi:DNA-binding Lrp family transcriptional regulator
MRFETAGKRETDMDELDVKLFRALVSESAVAPSRNQVNSSLRSIAKRLGADDSTVSYRYKRLQKWGCMSAWHLQVNPAFFGRGLLEVMVDVQPESAKPDMIRKLKLVGEVSGMVDFYGRALKLLVMYNGEESRLRTIELISRITNAESLTQVRWAVPASRTSRMTETDTRIIRSLSNDARKSFVQVARDLGLSVRTVRNHVERLRAENTVFSMPTLALGGIPGLIPVMLSYTYAKHDAKGTADRAMLSYFETSYLWGAFADPDNGWILLGVSSILDVQKCLEWASSQPWFANARVDILTKIMMFPEKQTELLTSGNEAASLSKKTVYPGHRSGRTVERSNVL